MPAPETTSPPGQVGVAVREAVRTLAPGYFALVMATGILSVGLEIRGLTAASVVMLCIAGLAYATLLVLTVWRLWSYPDAVRKDLTDPARAFGFFTFVAGTDVVGTALVAHGHLTPALAMLTVGCLSWIGLGYLVPWTAVLGRAQRPVLAGANGTWFIWVVASQSVAVLSASLQPRVGAGQRELAVIAVLAWSVGAFLYGAVGVFVALRLMLYDVSPRDLTPPYFVAMGATAITVLAGARIVEMAEAPMVDVTRGLIAGTSVAFWAFGTWLIPVLLAAGWWRHVTHRLPLRYEATLWSIMFPLGMYAVGSHYLGHADHLPIVSGVGATEIWVALAAWTVTFVAMLRHLDRTLLRRSAVPAGR